MSAIIRVEGVNKNYQLARGAKDVFEWCKNLIYPTYDDFSALHAINFNVEKGSAVGFIGPNGAGKSSLIKVLCGIQKATVGSVRVLGYNPALREKAFLNQIGVVFGHKTSLWWDLPVLTSLNTYQKIYSISDDVYRSRLGELTEALNLSRVLHKPVRNLSLGERVKCEITLNLLHSPKLIFLDEPTVGLDVTSKYEIRKYLNYKRKNDDLSIFLTSHDVGDIISCCEEAILIEKGQLRFNGTMDDLKVKLQENIQLVVTPESNELAASAFCRFKEGVAGLPHIHVLEDSACKVVCSLPRNALNTILDVYKVDGLLFEITPLDFENCLVNLFRAWSNE